MTGPAEHAYGYLEACTYDTHSMTNAEKVSLAQVHATLAIAEQQRVANLIKSYSAHYIDDHQVAELGDQILERLDLS